MSADHIPDYVLPPSLLGHAEIGRLAREVENLEGQVQAQQVRGGQLQLPALSQTLSDFMEQNKLTISDDKSLTTLKQHLRVIKDNAPVVHMTFANEADPYLLQKLVGWLRDEIHPYALVTIGLQPSLVGGVYLRTPNHVYDFSIRALLKGKRDIMVKELAGLHAG